MKKENQKLFFKLGALLSDLTEEQVATNAELQLFAQRLNNAIFKGMEYSAEELAEYDNKEFLENLINIAKGL